MYSQYDEEQYILQSLGDRADGHLVDIGAWDPIDKSNSRALIERGWSAVLIEPSPGPLKNLAKEYAHNPKVQVISGAITVEGHPIQLIVTDDALSQPSGDRLEAWRETGGFYGTITVPAISVVKLFGEMLGGTVDFVSIDTEGTSVDVCAEMWRLGVRPLVVVVEHDSRFVELSQHAQAANYRLLYENGTNRVYEWTGKR